MKTQQMIETLLHGATSTQRRTLLTALARAILRARRRGANKKTCVLITQALHSAGAFSVSDDTLDALRDSIASENRDDD